jgi:hypothetical protein
MLRLFIFEPLESFDANVESDLDVLNIRGIRYAVKRNIFGAPGGRGGCCAPKVDA